MKLAAIFSETSSGSLNGAFPSSAVGNNLEYIEAADKIILEVNSWQSEKLIITMEEVKTLIGEAQRRPWTGRWRVILVGGIISAAMALLAAMKAVAVSQKLKPFQ